MAQMMGMNIIARLLRVIGLSLVMLLALAALSAPTGIEASSPLPDQIAHSEMMEPFTPTGHFVAVLTPTDQWNNEIPVVASPSLDNPGVIFASFQATGSSQNTMLRSMDGGQHWNTIQLPAPAYHAELVLSSDFAQDHTVFGAFGSAIYKSTDSGSQWSLLSQPPVAGIDLLRMSPNYTTDHTMFVGSYGGGVYRSTNSGLSWTFITTDTAPYVTDLEVSPGYPADPTVFISIYNDGIFRSGNGGLTWTHLSAPQFSPDFRITLSPDFDTDNTLFVGANGISDGGAFRSNTRGDSWTPIKGGAYTHLVVVSPNFVEDRTVIIGGGYWPPYISEDAGDTWYPMSGIPGLGAYGQKHNLVLAYEGGRLLPIASTNQTIYRYQWPTLGVSSILALVEPGNTGLVTVSMPLSVDEPAQAYWTASEDAAWLSVTPMSGTMPSTLTLVVDAAQVTDTIWTSLTLDTQWSLRQTETITVPVGAMVVRSRTYLPVVSKSRTGIYGRVTENGVTAAGIPLELRFYNGSAWSTLASTTTQIGGWFAFNTAPSLGAGQGYYVRYQNTTGTGRVWTWHTRALTTYAAGSSAHIGDFDIADIGLIAPANNAAVSLPHTFQWLPRAATPSDSYEFDLYAPNTGSPYFYTDPLLGYVGSYTLNALPVGFQIGQAYAWEIWVYSPDGGYGISFLPRMVSFTNNGKMVQRSMPYDHARLVTPRRAPWLLDLEQSPVAEHRQR
jgi:photosystem II stability/assembly factor-like uncharacterized protein